MKNKTILFLILGIFLISLVSAGLNTYGSYIKGEDVTIRQTCATCSYVKISVSYPNSTLALSNQAMTNKGGGVWTYNFNDTSVQGRYDVMGSGDLDGKNTSFDILYFDINEYGISYANFMAYAIFYLILIIISFVLMYKFATYNGKGVNDYNFFFWSAFLDLIIFVLIQVNGFGGTETLLVQIIKMIAFGSGAYFLAQGMFYSLAWKKSAYR